jgi:hypothetical protein
VLICWIALCVPQGACSGREAAPLEVTGWNPAAALNESIVIDFSADLDPLAVTHRSVRVVSGRGIPLAHRTQVRGRQLTLLLQLDESQVLDPPASLRVRLSGLPSLHALRSRGGAALSESRSIDVRLEARLARAGSVALRSINDRPTEERGVVSHHGTIVLAFDGVVDPGTVTPGNCPLFPIAAGLQLKPLLPDTRWSLVGTRCEILLEVPSGSGPVELIWKRLGLRGLDGRLLRGPLVVTLSSS